MECARNETPKTLTTYFQEELVDLELSVEWARGSPWKCWTACQAGRNVLARGKAQLCCFVLFFVLSTSWLVRSSTVSCFEQLLATTDSEQSMLETSCTGKFSFNPYSVLRLWIYLLKNLMDEVQSHILIGYWLLNHHA
jgi:hypothetical protein